MDDLSVLSDIQPTSKDGKAIVPAMVTLMHDFQEKFTTMFTELRNDFTKMYKTQDAKITRMEDEITCLKRHITKMEDKIQENDNYERRDTLVFSGSSVPPINNMEVCTELVSNLVKNTLKLNISPSDISTAHRLNTRKSTNQRDIIVKFCRRDIKVDIMKACRSVKPANLFVNEFLTPQSQTIAYVLRKAKKDFPSIVSGSTTLEGKNYVWIKAPNQNVRGAKDLRMAITSHSRLVEFCTKTLQKPLSYFVEEWTH